MHAIPDLPTGAPGARLRHLVGHYHGFGPRALLELFERLIDGRLRGRRAIVEELERAARLDPRIMRELGAYELAPQIHDITWTFRREPWPLEDLRAEGDAIAASGNRALDDWLDNLSTDVIATVPVMMRQRWRGIARQAASMRARANFFVVGKDV